MTTRLDFTTADLITCLICIREFNTKERKPKVLHCGHTVCEDCTETLRDKMTTVVQIRCPTCRQFTSRPTVQQCNTNFQLMGYLAEKEKAEAERTAKGEKAAKKAEPQFQFNVGRSHKMEFHIAAKKDLKGTELYLRKDNEGTTHVVFAGKTGSPEEILNYIKDNGVSVETGKVSCQMVYDEAGGRDAEKFVKVNTIAAHQSAVKCAKAPTKLEETVFTDSFELKATEENGKVKLELVRKEEVPKNGFGVLGGCMAKPSAKRLKELTSAGTSEPGPSSKPTTSAAAVEEPLPKRRRGRK